MFVDEIKGELTAEAYNVLSQAGIGSYEEMYGFLQQFPSIAKDSGIKLPFLSNLAIGHISNAAMNAVRAKVKNPVNFAKGSFSPPKSIVGNGYQQAASAGTPVAATGMPTTSFSPSIDYTGERPRAKGNLRCPCRCGVW